MEWRAFPLEVTLQMQVRLCWPWPLPFPQLAWASLGSASKESTCNAGDLGSIPGLGRSTGEGKGNPFQYSGLENSTGSQRVRDD